MFGRKAPPPKLVGAIAKREAAAKFNPKMPIKSKKEGKKSPVIPMTVIFGVSVVLAAFLTAGPLSSGGFSVNTGSHMLDTLIGGPANVSFTGTPDTDKLITIFIRGILIMLAGGIIPAVTYGLQKFLDKSMNVYYTCWGVTIGIVAAYFIGRDALGPLLKQVVEVFTK